MAADASRQVVLDSSFLIAWHNTRDVHHAAAARTMVELAAGRWGRPILLEYVFLEVVTVLMARRGLDAARAVADALLGAGDTDFVACSDLFVETYEVFRSQSRAELSFVDAAVVTVARRERAAVATFDRGFQGVAGVDVIGA